MIGQLGFTIPIYAPGSGGVPSTSTPLMNDLAPMLTSYQHTITDQGGFETLTLTLNAAPDRALEILRDWLMASVVVYSPDADVVWEGYIGTIEAVFGQETRSRSLEPTANRVRARYTTVNGVPGTTANASDTASQALYGVKELVLSLPTTTATGAQQLRDQKLAEVKNPPSSARASAASGGGGECAVTITCAGWYQALAWLYASNSTTSTAVTTTQVTSLITTYTATNAFLSTDYSLVTASGISDTQYIPADQMTYRDTIERLLRQGNSSSQRLAWGVYEGRRLSVGQWAGATPATVTYQRYLSDSLIYDSNANPVAPWLVRPNAMYQVNDLLDPAPVATAQDGPARFYVARVTFSAQAGQIGLELEPGEYDSLDVRLARLEKVQYGA